MGQVLAVAGVLTASLIPILCAWNDSGTKKITSTSAYCFFDCKPVIKSSTENVSSLRKEMQSHRIAMGQKERELQSAKQEIRNAAERENRLQGEIKSLRIAMEQNENRLQSEIKALRSTIEKSEKEMNELRSENKELHATVKCLKDEIHDLKKQVVTTCEQNAEFLKLCKDQQAEPVKRDIKKYAAKILKKLRDPSMDNGIAANDEKRIAQTAKSCLEWLRHNPHAAEDEYKERFRELQSAYAILSASTSTCTSSTTSNGVSMESSQIFDG